MVVYFLAGGVSPVDCHHLWVARLFSCEDCVGIAWYLSKICPSHKSEVFGDMSGPRTAGWNAGVVPEELPEVYSRRFSAPTHEGILCRGQTQHMSAPTDTAQRVTSFSPIPAEASEKFDSRNCSFLKQQKQSFSLLVCAFGFAGDKQSWRA